MKLRTGATVTSPADTFFGTVCMANDVIFTGSLFRDQPCGPGSVSWPNGDVHTCHWLFDAARHTVTSFGPGTFVTSTGVIYKGCWQRVAGDDTPAADCGVEAVCCSDLGGLTGDVSVEFDKSTTYAGEWSDGAPHGSGTMTWQVWNGENSFKGRWQHGKPCGLGTFVGFHHATKYTGAWDGPRRSGMGTEESRAGNRYTGEWLDNKRHGFGEFKVVQWTCDAHFGQNQRDTVTPSAEDLARNRALGHNTWTCIPFVYTGMWRRNMRHGQGKIVYESKHTFEGCWHCDQWSGYGVFTWPCGSTYKGEWKHGKRSGQGTQVYVMVKGEMSTGEAKEATKIQEVYTGEWRCGLRHGRGRHVRADGTEQAGWWVKDVLTVGPRSEAAKQCLVHNKLRTDADGISTEAVLITVASTEPADDTTVGDAHAPFTGVELVTGARWAPPKAYQFARC